MISPLVNSTHRQKFLSAPPKPSRVIPAENETLAICRSLKATSAGESLSHTMSTPGKMAVSASSMKLVWREQFQITCCIAPSTSLQASQRQAKGQKRSFCHCRSTGCTAPCHLSYGQRLRLAMDWRALDCKIFSIKGAAATTWWVRGSQNNQNGGVNMNFECAVRGKKSKKIVWRKL